MRRFLIINPFGIGDVLFTTPVIRAIKDRLPRAIICYWCNDRVQGILKYNPGVDKIIALSRGDIKKIYRKSIWAGSHRVLKLLHCIKKGNFDVAIDFSLDHRYSLIAKILGIKKRIGFNYKNRGMFLTDKIGLDGYSGKHVVEYYLGLLKPIGIQPKSYNLELILSQTAKRKSGDILREHGISDKDLIIGIAAGAGASWGQDASLKHWPAISFGKLADRLINDLGAKVILLGDASEEHISDMIISAMHNRPINLTGKTDLEELSAVINNLSILVTNDGGPLHMAAALGKKTLSFFGPVDPKVYGPYPPDEKRHIVLKKDLECSPCYIKFRLSDCKRNKECLETIDVDSAFNAVKKLL